MVGGIDTCRTKTEITRIARNSWIFQAVFDRQGIIQFNL